MLLMRACNNRVPKSQSSTMDKAVVHVSECDHNYDRKLYTGKNTLPVSLESLSNVLVYCFSSCSHHSIIASKKAHGFDACHRDRPRFLFTTHQGIRKMPRRHRAPQYVSIFLQLFLHLFLNFKKQCCIL